VYAALTYQCMRPYATSVCGLQLLVCEALSYSWRAGAYEACLDGRHGACRHIPAHYSALRDLLLDIANLARERDRQAAACQVFLVYAALSY